MPKGRIPLWPKLLWSAWVALWVAFFWHHFGLKNFVWLCGTANLAILAGLWSESSLLVPRTPRIPYWLKLLWTAWVFVWVPFYWAHYGPQNFLWFCDMANFMILAALWTESALLMSWQAVSVLLVQILWTIDFFGRLILKTHLIGGTQYMFQPEILLITRVLSLFHAAVPFVLLWGVWKLGYDRRAWLCQSIASWIVLPICYFGWGGRPGFEGGINWVVGPFDKPQSRVAPLLYLGLCMIAYPILLYAPTHFALRFLFKRRAISEKAVANSYP